MNHKQLLDAIGEIDETAVLDAKEMTGLPGQTRQSGFRRAAAMMTAAVFLVALVGAVVAVSFAAADWFKEYYTERLGSLLMPVQWDLPEHNAKTVNRGDTVGGYTVMVDAAVTDGKTALIKLALSAPEDRITDSLEYSFDYMDIGPTSQKTEIFGKTITMTQLDDGDGSTDTVELVMEVTLNGEETFYIADQWQMRLTYLRAGEPAAEDGTGASEVVCYGIWTIDLEFDTNVDMVDLVGEPVDGWGLYEDADSDLDCPIRITAVRLSNMTMEVEYGYSNPEDQYGELSMPGTVIVLKDGTRIGVSENQGSFSTTQGKGTISFDLSAPIDLEDVEHILLYKDVEIPAE